MCLSCDRDRRPGPRVHDGRGSLRACGLSAQEMGAWRGGPAKPRHTCLPAPRLCAATGTPTPDPGETNSRPRCWARRGLTTLQGDTDLETLVRPGSRPSPLLLPRGSREGSVCGRVRWACNTHPACSRVAHRGPCACDTAPPVPWDGPVDSTAINPFSIPG